MSTTAYASRNELDIPTQRKIERLYGGKITSYLLPEKGKLTIKWAKNTLKKEGVLLIELEDIKRVEPSLLNWMCVLVLFRENTLIPWVLLKNGVAR